MLDISSNGISHFGAEKLFNCLQNNESVVDLILASELKDRNPNKIGMGGAWCLSMLLKMSGFITFLNIKGNCLGNEGFNEVCNSISFNNSI